MNKQRILICDDEESARESLNLVLSDKYDLTFAANSEEAIESFKANSDIKIALIDIKMPKKSGLDLLKDIKSLNSDINVIIVTAYQNVETAAEAIKQGASNYIIKPFEPKNVIEAVKKASS
ncbi:response regulator [Candidatus Omnitrophota bacterium]